MADSENVRDESTFLLGDARGTVTETPFYQKKSYLIAGIAVFALIALIALIVMYTMKCNSNDSCYPKAAVAADARNCSQVGSYLIAGIAVIALIALIALIVMYTMNRNSNDSCYPKAAVAADARNCSQVGSYLIAGIAVFALIALIALIVMYTMKCNSNDSCYPKAAVAADARNCSQVGSYLIAGIAVIALIALIALIVMYTMNRNSNDSCYPKAAVAADARNCSQVGSYLIAGIAVFALIALIALIVMYTMKCNSNDSCYPKAAVAADARNCSQVGRDILMLKNGSAVDAAIATLLCVGLYNPQNMGIGGGVVFTIYDASTGKVETIDARETAPQKSSANMFDKDPQKTESVIGGLSIAVPGLLRGFKIAHERHGRLEWKDLVLPSIKMARKGVTIGKAMAEALEEKREMIQNSTTWCNVFCDSNNKTLEENGMIKLLKLVDTYELIANEGPDVFYTGSLSEKIVKDVQAEGGIITSEDLRGYEPRVHEHALNFTMGNYTFHVPSAPFGGPVLAMILKILDGYNFTHNSLKTKESKILTYHRVIEAFRFTYARKSELGDPTFQKSSEVNDIIRNMTLDETARSIRSKIDDTTTKPDSYYGNNISPPYDSGTSHLSIIAEDGSAVSVTSSINDLFGSTVMSPSTGIIFNNQMSDFSRHKQGENINMNNLIQPGKRPLSSMCPTIIMDNSQPKHKRVKMVVGASGWTKIPTAIAQVVLNYLFFDYDLEKSVDEPRIHNGWKPNVTYIEKNFDESVLEGLRQKNHEIKVNESVAEIHVAARQGDRICAECDWREGGAPAGY